MQVTPTAQRTLALLRFQSAEFKALLNQALTFTAQGLQRGNRPYIAFSGGKDSIVTTALVHALDESVPLVWSDDELELPATVDYMSRVKAVAGEQFLIVPGQALHSNWFRPWTDRPFFREPLPGTLQHGLDEEVWRKQQGWDLVFLGLRAEENAKRKAWFLQAGGLYPAKGAVRWRCSPIHRWSADDVWALIHGWGLGYNRAYDEMTAAGIEMRRQRVGPLPMCPRWILQEVWPDLLERLETRYQRQWDENPGRTLRELTT